MSNTCVSTARRLVLLAPVQSTVPPQFKQVIVNTGRYHSLLHAVQRFRGSIYVADGAIPVHQLAPDGRHEQNSDSSGWHIVMLDSDDQVCGCSRLVLHSANASFAQLGIKHSALAQNDTWGHRLKAAVSSEMAQARLKNMGYVEVGGWALAAKLRCTTEALRIALGTYGLGQALGGVLGVTMATLRHCSSSILRRIGGACLHHNGADLPSYFDPQYECEMEMLRFNSQAPNPKYASRIDAIKHQLMESLVYCGSAAKSPVTFISNATGFGEVRREYAAAFAHEEAACQEVA